MGDQYCTNAVGLVDACVCAFKHQGHQGQGQEVRGRWSAEMRTFVAQLAKAKVRQEPRLLQKRAEQAWRMRWGAILSCAAAKAVATCLLD